MTSIGCCFDFRIVGVHGKIGRYDVQHCVGIGCHFLANLHGQFLPAVCSIGNEHLREEGLNVYFFALKYNNALLTKLRKNGILSSVDCESLAPFALNENS